MPTPLQPKKPTNPRSRIEHPLAGRDCQAARMRDHSNAMVGAMLVSLMCDWSFCHCAVAIIVGVEAVAHAVQMCMFVQYVLSMT